MGKVDPKARKLKLWNQIQSACQTYSKCLFVNVDNVTSKQICVMRKAIREMGGKMIMGKNVSSPISDTCRLS
jgi:ribosomal protein L10